MHPWLCMSSRWWTVVHCLHGRQTRKVGVCLIISYLQSLLCCWWMSTYRVSSVASICPPFIADINECEPPTETHNCEQRCTNTDGSYQCACDTGYELRGDGRTCNGVLFLLLLLLFLYVRMCVSVCVLYWLKPKSMALLGIPFDTLAVCSNSDINECNRGTDNCDEQLCRNMVPGFECYCMDGYKKATRSTFWSTINTCVGERQLVILV